MKPQSDETSTVLNPANGPPPYCCRPASTTSPTSPASSASPSDQTSPEPPPVLCHLSLVLGTVGDRVIGYESCSMRRNLLSPLSQLFQLKYWLYRYIYKDLGSYAFSSIQHKNDFVYKTQFQGIQINNY